MADTGTGPREKAERNPAVDRLMEELEAYLGAQAQRLLGGVGRKLGETTGKLNDVAEGRSPGLVGAALEGGRKIAQGKGPLRTAAELGAGRLKDRTKSAVKGLGEKLGGVGKGDKEGRSGNKPTVILEHIDIGLPLSEVYDQWTQFQEFGTFAKGVESVKTEDETTSNWNGKILWSSRSWKGTTDEQIPDERIAWNTEAAKGTHKGVVTFHALGDRLTRVLLLIEYYPSGFFEKTGNIWRAPGRRVRLDLKNFARFVMLRGEATGAWRGEIRDGEVVRGPEEEEPEDEYDEEEGEEEEEEEEEQEQGEEPQDEYPKDEYEEEEEEEGADEEARAHHEEGRDREYQETSGRSRR